MKQSMQPKAKEPVKIRFKALADGNKSIYLDIYMNGKRSYEYLKIYLVPERTALDRETNRRMMELANAIKSQKIVELQNDAHGFSNSGVKQKANFIDYVQKLSDEKRQASGNVKTYQLYNALIRHLKQYGGDKTTFNQVQRTTVPDLWST
ncbi:MAG: hypothetical protein LBP25_00715 [Tannerellaceae bacterium]|jgi:beta-glucosidase-like glycosyl hydrolase|nr:hypothetical protein [Tannerellaceae bacterium]